MEVLLLVAVGVTLLLAFVLVPLLQEEDDLKPFRRPRPGTRHLHGLESTEVDIPDVSERQCTHCGAAVGEGFFFCGECCKPLP